MPERLAYDEAMLFSSIRLKIQNPDLKQGKVETITVQTVVGPVERPWGLEGGFAVVYKFRSAGGSFRALRCFRVSMNPDTQFRYEHIDPYFHQHIRDITVGFHYHHEGILIKEQVQGKMQSLIYPVIEMDWVEGVTLVDRVDELCAKRDRSALRDLCNQWLALLRRLRQAHIAHGDLAGVNVLVKTDGQLVLIDYDGVYVPELAGLPQLLLGQADYQHPQMAKRQFNEHMDAFSALVIYTVLLALAAQPELWNKYTKRSQQGKLLDINMLLSQKDFLEPQQSAIFQDLEQCQDQQVRQLAHELKHACQQNVDQVTFPFSLLDPDAEKKQALAAFLLVMQSNDDQQIVNGWSPLLHNYPAAQKYQQHFQEAQRRLKALQTFQDALHKGSLAEIASTYDPVLDTSQQITSAERYLLTLARAFIQAYSENNDEHLLQTAQSIQAQKACKVTFTHQEQQRLTLLQERQQALVRLRAALDKQDIEQIAAAYVNVQQQSSLTELEHQQGKLACDFMRALGNDNDDALLNVYEAILHVHQRIFFLFTDEQKQRVQLAQQRQAALTQLRAALTSKSLSEIAAAYQPILNASKALTENERKQVELARAFSRARNSDDDQAVVDAYYAILHSPLYTSFLLTFEEQDYVTQAWKRQELYRAFEQALATRDPDQIVLSYDSLLDTRVRTSTEEAERLRLARLFVASRAQDEHEQIRVYDEIQNSASSQFFVFSTADQQRIATIRQWQKMQELQSALKQKAYGQALKIAQRFTPTEHKQFESRMYTELSKACKNFIKKCEMEEIIVTPHTYRAGSSLEVTYRWPAEELVKFAVVFWNTETYPQSPQEVIQLDPSWSVLNRRKMDRVGAITIPINGRHNSIYTLVCTAIYDSWRNEPYQHSRYYFSQGVRQLAKPHYTTGSW